MDKIRTENFKYDDWLILCSEGPILASTGEERNSFLKELDLPHIPDMVFPHNILELTYAPSGVQLTFTALEALKAVDCKSLPPFQVDGSAVWQEARKNCSYVKCIEKPYDWTYYSDFQGILLNPLSKPLQETEKGIDIERLKKLEDILFYKCIVLYEDEIGDNGISKVDVRIRVMPSFYLVLLRSFVRVDKVIAKVSETRYFYSLNDDCVTKERTLRESAYSHFNALMFKYKMPDDLIPHLVVKSCERQRIPVI